MSNFEKFRPKKPCRLLECLQCQNNNTWVMGTSRDFSRDDWIKEFIKRKWSSGLFWAVGAAEKKKGLGRLWATFWSGFFNFWWSKNKSVAYFFNFFKLFQKVAYLWQLGVFSLCSPDCPKHPRNSFPFYKFFYLIVSAKVSGSSVNTVLFGSSELPNISHSVTKAETICFSSELFKNSDAVWKILNGKV